MNNKKEQLQWNNWVAEATDHCLKKLGEAIKSGRLHQFKPGAVVRNWAKEHNISPSRIKAFVQEVKRTFEGAVLTYGLVEDIQKRRQMTIARAKRLFYSGVYTLYEPKKSGWQEKEEE